MSGCVEKDFVFQFKNGSLKSCLTVPLRLPPECSARDLRGRLVAAHNLPCYVEDDLLQQLEEFIAVETSKLQDENAESSLRALDSGGKSAEDKAESWAHAFTRECTRYSDPEAANKDHQFAMMYHALIHSSALETLLNLEHTYAVANGDVINHRENARKNLEDKQHQEMESAMQGLGVTHTDEQVNTLAQKHFDSTQKLEVQWDHEVCNLQKTQRDEYREWVKQVHQDMEHSNGNRTTIQRIRAMSDAVDKGVDDNNEPEEQPRLEESFTIHLGAQMKTMHNIRLMRAHPLDLCRHKPNKIGGTKPQRLQTALSLYSNTLCGLVLLVDNRVNAYTGIKRDFSSACQQSTDFHFPALQDQFSSIQEDLVRANSCRLARQAAREEEEENGSNGSADSEKSKSKSFSDLNRLQAGDFYITRHSNLAEVHVVFHLVADDSLRSTNINARNPTILGLRSILKVACRHDILTLTVPLLLVHEMGEEMTVQWCLKRAELIFKCIKGFMMEMASWGGTESRTIQFMVPEGISDEMFHQFSNMLPQIFRVSTPLDLSKAK
ncbi:protein C12orf4 homolog [Branchiostoma floridae]|uniref:Protein C12orf4 homolog n=1 Tax=Branchiostoma floridae TaxID=7739 RepID=A0A9J7L2V3_BRAFL|nr:protein C12orf4 homolog [Branchiostoma floridae]